jgi:hypothetical protein
VVVETPHGGIVAGIGADQQPFVVGGVQAAQNLRQLAWGELARSPGAVAELGEPAGLGIHTSNFRIDRAVRRA